MNTRELMTGKCCNCGKPSQKYNETFWKWSIAHILPKKLFESISRHELNWIELCLDCHNLYDRNWLTASKMSIFQLVIKRVILLMQFIEESEKDTFQKLF